MKTGSGRRIVAIRWTHTTLVALLAVGVVAVGCSEEPDPSDESNDGEVGEEASPEFEADPEVLEFGDDAVERTVKIHNAGAHDSELVVEDVRLTEETDGAFLEGPDWPDEQVVLEGGVAMPIAVQHAPTEPVEYTGAITMETNDEAHPSPTIELVSPVPPSGIWAEPPAVDFGEVQKWLTETRMLELEQVGDEPVEITDLKIESDTEVFELEIDGLGWEEWSQQSEPVLDVDESLFVEVVYGPTSERTDRGRLVVETDEGQQSVRLHGDGIHEDCPIARIKATNPETGETIEQGETMSVDRTTSAIDLSGLDSFSPGGDDLSYNWSVTDSPSDLGWILIEPNEYDPSPTLEMDENGYYRVELEVLDQGMTPSCETAAVEIERAMEPGEITIELDWEAPEVVDQYGGADSDSGIGTDLNARYLPADHPWDWAGVVSHSIQHQDWEKKGVASLDSDDWYGDEGETITHTYPADGQRYSYGVHYYCDNDWGLSNADVRVYWDDELQYHKEGKLGQTGAFWYVGDVVWDEEDPTFDFVDEYEESMPKLSDCEGL